MAASVLSAPMASIGVPKEIKLDEQRVALTPDAVRELVSQGLEVRIETGAGAGAGIGDEAFAATLRATLGAEVHAVPVSHRRDAHSSGRA